MKAVVIYESMYGNTHQIARRSVKGCGLTPKLSSFPSARPTPSWSRAPTSSSSVGRRTRTA